MTQSRLFLFWLAALFWLFSSLIAFSHIHAATPPNGIDVGQTFTDPTFGTTIRRLSNAYPGVGSSLIYNINGFWNANGTLYLHDIGSDGTIAVIDAMTGAMVVSTAPFNTSESPEFDPVNPDTVYYFSGPNLIQYSVSAKQSTILKTFAAELGSLGGSVDFMDRIGRYFLLDIGGQLKIWDKQTDTLYTGSIPASVFNQTGGWAGISPDGNHVIISSDQNHMSYAVDNANKTLSENGVLFWTLCGDHGDISSPGDGHTYQIVFNCYNESAIYRVDVSDGSKVKLLDTTWNDSGHFSCARKSDTCFVSIESGNAAQTQSYKYKNEILRIKMTPPFTVEELAKHDSAGPSYNAQPRVDAFWDGSKAMFASDFGYNNGNAIAGYSDIYAIETATSAPVPPPVITPPTPTVPALTPATLLTRTLSHGMRGTDVIVLQQFLFSHGLFLSQNITGYFGNITRAAVQTYQCQKLSLCSGSELTTGYGLVGPRTRAAIANDTM